MELACDCQLFEFSIELVYVVSRLYGVSKDVSLILSIALWAEVVANCITQFLKMGFALKWCYLFSRECVGDVVQFIASKCQ